MQVDNSYGQPNAVFGKDSTYEVYNVQQKPTQGNSDRLSGGFGEIGRSLRVGVGGSVVSRSYLNWFFEVAVLKINAQALTTRSTSLRPNL